MSAYTDYDNMDRIAALESKVRKQQAEINQMILFSERCQKAVLEMAAVLEQISAGKE